MCDLLALNEALPGVIAQETIFLQNTSPNRVSYKIKTTAPKDFCVKPSCGYLSSGEKINVSGENVLLRQAQTLRVLSSAHP